MSNSFAEVGHFCFKILTRFEKSRLKKDPSVFQSFLEKKRMFATLVCSYNQSFRTL